MYDIFDDDFKKKLEEMFKKGIRDSISLIGVCYFLCMSFLSTYVLCKGIGNNFDKITALIGFFISPIIVYRIIRWWRNNR